MEIFGFNVTKASKKPVQPIVPKVKAEELDGALEINSGAATAGHSNLIATNFEAAYGNKIELINLYRTMALEATVSDALEDIINESIVNDAGEDVLNLTLDNTEFGEDTKKKIRIAFEKVLSLLNFNNTCQDIFKKWFIDGRLYAYMVLPKRNEDLDIGKKTQTGIEEIRILDPRGVEFIRELDENTGEYTEYFLYNKTNPRSLSSDNPTEKNQAIQASDKVIIRRDAMVYTPSGEYDLAGNVVSFMHPAIKPYNQLISLEDYSVIYRMVRSTERRVFYIDIGELPKTKAEQYMTSIISQHSNKLQYDANTGKMTEQSNMRSMLEDIWLPRRDGQRATEVDTLQGGVNVGEMEDVEYFRKKLYLAMHIPLSRLDYESRFQLGRGGDITRDELKFNRYIEKLRRRFNQFVLDLLKTEVVLNSTVTLEEWNDERNNILLEYNEDAHFAELKRAELMEIRLMALGSIGEYIGTFFSVEQIHKDVLRRSEEEIKEIMDQIKDEKAKGIIPKEDDGGF